MKMEAVHDIERLVGSLRVKTSAAADERILRDASAALAQSMQNRRLARPSSSPRAMLTWIGHRRWVKYAAAAVALIVIALPIALSSLARKGPTSTRGSVPAAGNGSGTPRREARSTRRAERDSGLHRAASAPDRKRRAREQARGEGALLGSELSIEQAVRQSDYVGTCSARSKPELVAEEAGLQRFRQEFREDTLLWATQRRMPELDYEVNVALGERPLRVGEWCIWMAAFDPEGGWKGVKALPNTPENRAAVTRVARKVFGWGSKASGLRCALSIPKRQYGLTEEIPVTIEIENVSASDVALWSWPDNKAFVIFPGEDRSFGSIVRWAQSRISEEPTVLEPGQKLNWTRDISRITYWARSGGWVLPDGKPGVFSVSWCNALRVGHRDAGRGGEDVMLLADPIEITLQSDTDAPWGEVANGLQCRLTPLQQTYEMIPREDRRPHGPLVTYEIRNVSDRPLKFLPFFTPLSPVGKVFTVIGPDGWEVRYRGLSHELARFGPEAFRTLAPGQVFVRRTMVTHGFSVPGPHWVSVTTVGRPAPDGQIIRYYGGDVGQAKKNSDNVWTGMLKSNTVTVNVVRPAQE